MFDIGFSELVLTSVIALIVLGPERLPKAARTVGLIVGKIRRSFNGLQEELERQVRTEELREKMKDPFATYLDIDEQTHRTTDIKANGEPSSETNKSPSESGAPKS